MGSGVDGELWKEVSTFALMFSESGRPFLGVASNCLKENSYRFDNKAIRRVKNIKTNAGTNVKQQDDP